MSKENDSIISRAKRRAFGSPGSGVEVLRKYLMEESADSANRERPKVVIEAGVPPGSGASLLKQYLIEGPASFVLIFESPPSGENPTDELDDLRTD